MNNNKWLHGFRDNVRNPTQEFQVFRLTSDLHGTTNANEKEPERTSFESDTFVTLWTRVTRQGLLSVPSFLILDTAKRKYANYGLKLPRYDPCLETFHYPLAAFEGYIL